jgi:2-haloacid dehalogenase
MRALHNRRSVASKGLFPTGYNRRGGLIRAVTFDLYGTLVDWEHSISRLLEALGVDRRDFFARELRAVSSSPTFRPYSDVLKNCLREMLGEAYDELKGEALVRAFAKSPPFPDALLGLPMLKSRGYKLGIISNTERRLVKITLHGLEDLFDWIVTAQDTGYYKPRPEAFVRAFELMGLRSGEVLHASSYPAYDLEPASKLGIRCALVDRYGYAWKPTVRTVDELIHLL